MMLDDLTDALFSLKSDILEAERRFRLESSDLWSAPSVKTKEPSYLIKLRQQRTELLREIDRLAD